MSLTLVKLWQVSSDDEVRAAAADTASLNDEARRVVLAELANRGILNEIWACPTCGEWNSRTEARCTPCAEREAASTAVRAITRSGLFLCLRITSRLSFRINMAQLYRLMSPLPLLGAFLKDDIPLLWSIREFVFFGSLVLSVVMLPLGFLVLRLQSRSGGSAGTLLLTLLAALLAASPAAAILLFLLLLDIPAPGCP
jgi:hypothetical protein